MTQDTAYGTGCNEEGPASKNLILLLRLIDAVAAAQLQIGPSPTKICFVLVRQTVVPVLTYAYINM